MQHLRLLATAAALCMLHGCAVTGASLSVNENGEWTTSASIRPDSAK